MVNTNLRRSEYHAFQQANLISEDTLGPDEIDRNEVISYFDHDFASNNNIVNALLNGNPSKYPFDNYSLNFVLIVPFGHASYNYTSNPDDSIYTSWIPRSNLSLIKPNSQLYNWTVKSTVAYDLYSQKFNNKFSLMDLRFDFYRNYTIGIVIVPLVTIFFLLGAIFIFENSSDSIGNRLALALGIFALIFTLPEIINSMKPQTSGPTALILYSVS